MDDEPTGAADEDATAVGEASTAVDGEQGAEAAAEVDPHVVDDEPSPGDEIIELPWDDDMPVALGEETDSNGRDDAVSADGAVDELDDLQRDDGEGLGDAGGDGDEVRTDEYFARRRRETRRGLDSWRTRSATGAIASAIAMGLQQVFEPEKRRPAAVAEAPSDPYSDDDPVTVEYVPDDAEATTVRVKPWLLQKGDPI